MYSIDKQQTITVNTGSEIAVIDSQNIQPGLSLVRRNIKPINEFDLVNISHFDLNGNVVMEALNPKDYDFEFSKRLASIMPMYRIGNFLQYQYQQTPDKALFLQHIQFHVVLYWHRGEKKILSEREKYIIAWIEKKKGEGTKGETPPQKFESYLNAKGKKLLPYLVKTYSNAKPQIIAFMLCALKKLKYLEAGSLANQTNLHEALKETFGNIGQRQSLNTNLHKLATPDEYLTNQINTHMTEISKAAKTKN